MTSDEPKELPTKCKDWSLNNDRESEKTFWWNRTHSISIWQATLKVPSPEMATDDIVWHQFLQYQLESVYKLCALCLGPEQNETLSLCCRCGGTVHRDCSSPPSNDDLQLKPVNMQFKSVMRVCGKCSPLPTGAPAKPIVREKCTAMRAALRALAITNEYPPAIRNELQQLVAECERGGDEDALIHRVQIAVRSFFQPGDTQHTMKIKTVPSKGGGVGVFALQKIPRFTVIGIYPGYEDTLSGEQAKLGRPGPKYSLVDLDCADYFNVVFDELQLCFTPFLNEPSPSEESNTGWIQETVHDEGRLSVMTVRDVMPGEELLIGYGPLYPRSYPHNYDAFAFHKVDGYDDPPCFACWRWKSTDEKDAEFFCYCGYDSQSGVYTYWETEDEASKCL